MRTRLSARAVLVVLAALLLGACATATNGTGQASPTTSAVAAPKIVKAWFGPIAWDPAANRYKATLHVEYPPTEGPLYFEWITAWTLWDNSSGVSRSWGQRDISHLAKIQTGKHLTWPWTWTYKGEYTLTVRLRNSAGTATVDVPITIP